MGDTTSRHDNSDGDEGSIPVTLVDGASRRKAVPYEMALTLSDPASTLYDQAAKWLSEDDPSNLELWLDEMTVLPNTSTTSASAALEKMGKRVLLIDDRRPTNLPAEFVVLFRSRPNVVRVTFKAAQSLSNKVGLDAWVSGSGPWATSMREGL